LTFPRSESYHLAFSADGRTLAVGGDEKTRDVVLWELLSGKERARLNDVPADRYAQLCFSPDGRWLAVQEERFIQLWDIRHGKKVHTFKGHESGIEALTFSLDGRTLISGSYDTTILVWDVAGVVSRQPRPAPRADRAVLAAWDDLARADANAAYRAVTVLIEAPAPAVRLLRSRLQPAPLVDAERVNRLLARLDSNVFANRERAMKELKRLGTAIEPAVRKFLEGGPSPKARRRVESVLKEIVGVVTDPDKLRWLRAVEVLEGIADSKACKLLGELARGTPEARLTREAQASLKRLNRRPRMQP
jgi:hypothetical protein